MARIRSRDTGPELALRRALWAIGLRGWRIHGRGIPGSPDVAFGRARVAIFVDGRFWHGHPDFFTPGKSGSYWDQKIQRTRERDVRLTRELEELGWLVLRFWDFAIERDVHSVARQVAEATRRRAAELATAGV